MNSTIKPDWNSPEVVRAMLLLLQTGLEDLAVGRFLFGTESCVPMYDGEYIHNKLFEDDVSWLTPSHRPEGKWEAAACFLSVDPSIIPAKVYLLAYCMGHINAHIHTSCVCYVSGGLEVSSGMDHAYQATCARGSHIYIKFYLSYT